MTGDVRIKTISQRHATSCDAVWCVAERDVACRCVTLRVVFTVFSQQVSRQSSVENKLQGHSHSRRIPGAWRGLSPLFFSQVSASVTLCGICICLHSVYPAVRFFLLSLFFAEILVKLQYTPSVASAEASNFLTCFSSSSFTYLILRVHKCVYDAAKPGSLRHVHAGSVLQVSRFIYPPFSCLGN